MFESNLVPNQYFSSELLSQEDRFPAWQEACNVAEEPVLKTDSDLENFRGELKGYMMSSLVFIHAKSICQDLIRTPKLVAQSGLDHVYITCFISGGYTIETQNSITKVQAGDIQLLGLEQSYKISLHPDSNGFERVLLMIPRDKLAHRLPNLDYMHQSLLKADSPMNALLKNYLLMLKDNLARLSVEQAERMSEPLFNLIATCFSDKDVVYSFNQVGYKEHLFPSIKKCISENIGNPDLCASFLAENLYISTATLARVCSQFGGVTNTIRRCRLLAAYRMLLLEQKWTIQQIAYRVGFNNKDTFSRAFRREFGYLPSEVRSEKPDDTLSKALNKCDLSTWQNWVHTFV